MTITEVIANLHWVRPLWLIGLLPSGLLFLWLTKVQPSDSQWKRVINPALAEYLLDNTANRRATRRRSLPLIGAALASSLAIIAMAGPSWEKLPKPVVQQENALLIIADLTLSMHAEDIAPSRLVRMRYKILELLKQRNEGQTALIAYSGDAHIVSPLTDDANNIAALVPALSPEVMPVFGSNARAAFELSQSLLASQNNTDSTIVWLTDQVLQRDKAALKKLVAATDSKLVVIGIGTTSGGPVPLPSGKFLTDSAGTQVVNAKLETRQLQLAAQAAGGKYLKLQANNSDIDYIVALIDNTATTQEESPSTRREFKFDQWRDLGGYIALALLPAALLAFRRGWLLLLAYSALPLVTVLSLTAVSAPTAQAQESAKSPDRLPQTSNTTTKNNLLAGWNNLWQTKNQQGANYLDQGDHLLAAEFFEDPAWQGISNYRGQQYEQSLDNFKQALQHSLTQPNASAAEKAANHYNLGHALARSGQLEEAIDAYDQALTENPGMASASQAKSIVESLLEQKQQQEEQQQQNQKQDGEKSDSAQNNDSSSNQQNAQNQSDQQKSQADNPNQAGSTSNEQTGNQPAEQQQSQSEPQADPANEAANEASAEPDQDQHSQSTVDQQQLSEDENQNDDNKQQSMPVQQSDELDPTQQAKLQQWLKQIEDDPSGLLRRKFKYEQQRREQEGELVDRSEDGQLW